jgi:hypothetical protein
VGVISLQPPKRFCWITKHPIYHEVNYYVIRCIGNTV